MRSTAVRSEASSTRVHVHRDVRVRVAVHGESQIREHFVARIALLLGLSGARSGCPLSASAGDSRPARRSRRRPFGGGRIRAYQAPTPDLQSFSETVTDLRTSDRVVAGLCAFFMRPGRLIRSAIVIKPSTVLRLHRALIQRKYRRLFSSTRPTRPGPKGPSQDVHRCGHRHEAAEPKLGMSTDRAPDHTRVRYSHQQGCGVAHSRCSVPSDTRLGGTVLAHGAWSRERQSVES